MPQSTFLGFVNKLCPISWIIYWLTMGYPLFFTVGLWIVKKGEIETKGVNEWQIDGKCIAITIGFIGVYVFIEPRYIAVFGLSLIVLAKEAMNNDKTL